MFARELYVALKEGVKSNPVAFSSLWRLEESSLHHRKVVRPDFHIVIEGFPRSGNTFSTTAFRLSQDDPDIRIANHFHTVAQFRLAARWGVPALLVIREPRATVLSNAVFHGDLSVPFLIRHYIRFHRSLSGLRGSFVVGDFRDLTTDFGAVINRVNQRFHTAFVCFEHNEANTAQVMRVIDEHHDRLVSARAESRREFQRTTPSEFKKAQREALESRLDAREARRLLEDARAVYEDLVGSSP